MRIYWRRKCHPKLWHSWFAWRPVRIGCEIVWLESVERKATGTDRGGNRIYEYRNRP